VVFTQTESRAVIAEMKGARRLIAGLLYGSDLRMSVGQEPPPVPTS